jgi:hypothetical protein
MDYTGQRVDRTVIPDPLEVDTLVANHVEAGTVNVDLDLSVQGDIEAAQDVNVEGELKAGAVSVNYLGGGYQLPVLDGTPGQVLTTDGSSTAQWTDATPTESKGDLLFCMTEATIIETTILQWFNLAGEPPSDSLGSLTIPANSMQVGDVYTLLLTGQFAVSTTADLELEFKIEVNGIVIAFTGTAAPITIKRHTGVQTDPKVPFRMEIQFVVRTDPTAFPLQLDNVHCIPQISYSTDTSDIQGAKGAFLDIFPFSPNNPLTLDNTAPVELAVYGQILGGGIAGIRVQHYTMTKQFVGFETTGTFTNQALNTTDDVTFASVNSTLLGLPVKGVFSYLDPAPAVLGQLPFYANPEGTLLSNSKITTDGASLNLNNQSIENCTGVSLDGVLTIGTTPNEYTFPQVRGVTGQILQDSGAGVLNWYSPPPPLVGGVHQFGNVTNTTFTFPGQWQTVVGDSFVGGLLDGFTLAGTATQPALQYDGENGRYLKLFVSVAWQDAGGAGNAEYVLSIHRNGNLLFDTWISSQLDATVTYPRAASTGSVALANTGDVFEVKIRNNTNTNAALVKDMTFSAHTI